MSDYKPIDCGLYSRYELAILRRQRLLLSWRDARSLVHLEVVEPHDLETCKGAEYLLASAGDGRKLRLRLDHISQTRVME
ncbi:MAG: transcriptional antiterminator, Rof [Pseudomonadota bacterium]